MEECDVRLEIDKEKAGIEVLSARLISAGYQKGYKAGLAESEMNEKSYSDGVEDGMKKAWETAKKIVLKTKSGGLSCGILEACFGGTDFDKIFNTYTPSEVIGRIEKYEKEQEENERCCRCAHGCKTGRLKHNLCCDECVAGSNYKEKQDKIKVGDEVVNDITGSRFVIIKDEESPDGSIVGINNSYRLSQTVKVKNLRKTGRTFPQIAEVLEQMKDGYV